MNYTNPLAQLVELARWRIQLERRGPLKPFPAWPVIQVIMRPGTWKE